jgi:hypothetical protein
VNKIYTHNLSDLLRLSGLQTELEAAETDPNLARGWSIIKNWSENARFAMYDEDVAVEMLNAVDGEHGLLQWLINRW